MYKDNDSTNYMTGYISPSDEQSIMYPAQDRLTDEEYFISFYPKEARQILEIISDELDKLEYEGSILFHEYPDREYLNLILYVIINKIKKMGLDTNSEDALPTDITWDNTNSEEYDQYDDILESLQTTCVPSSCYSNGTYSIAEVSHNADYFIQLSTIIFINDIMKRRNRYFNHKEQLSRNRNSAMETQDKY